VKRMVHMVQKHLTPHLSETEASEVDAELRKLTDAMGLTDEQTQKVGATGDGIGELKAVLPAPAKMRMYEVTLQNLQVALEYLYPENRVVELKMLAKKCQEETHGGVQLRWATQAQVMLALVAYVMALVILPMLCRQYLEDAWQRCVVMVLVVIVMNLMDIQPLFTTALMVPLLAIVYHIFPKLTPWEASLLVMSRMINDTSFLLLGAFVTCAIMTKCQLEVRIGGVILPMLHTRPNQFFLALMVSSLLLASVLFGGAAALLMLSTVLPTIRDLPVGSNHTKRWLLGICFSCNFGAFLLPISGPPALIAISLLREYGKTLNFGLWMCVSIPVCFCVVITAWVLLCLIFPVRGGSPYDDAAGTPRTRRTITGDGSGSVRRRTPPLKEAAPLTAAHWFFILLVIVFLVLVACSTLLEHIIGSAAILALLFVALAFGSGFLGEDELRNLPWDIILIVAGGNVIAFCLRESGLALIIAREFMGAVTVSHIWYMCALVCVTLGVIGNLFSSTMIALMFFPVVAILAIKVGAPQVVMILAVFAVQSACCLEFSSLDNLTIYKFAEDDQRRRYLSRNDFARAGTLVTASSLMIHLSVGFGLAILCFGMPDPEAARRADRELSPTRASDPEKQKRLEARIRRLEAENEANAARAKRRGDPYYEYVPREKSAMLLDIQDDIDDMMDAVQRGTPLPPRNYTVLVDVLEAATRELDQQYANATRPAATSFTRPSLSNAPKIGAGKGAALLAVKKGQTKKRPAQGGALRGGFDPVLKASAHGA